MLVYVMGLSLLLLVYKENPGIIDAKMKNLNSSVG